MSPSVSAVTQSQLSVSVDGNPTPDDAKVDAFELAASRRALKFIKNRIGPEGMMALLAPDFREGQGTWDDWLEQSGGELRLIKVEMTVKGLTVGEFEPLITGINKEIHFAMHPEHMVPLFDLEGGILRIGETEGDDFYKLFVMHIGEEGPIEDELDSSCTYRFAGVMRNAAGDAEACVLHQFKDTPDGMYAKVSQWVPAAAPDDVTKRVHEHLAIEFANLFRMAKFDGELSQDA